ncbi:MAG: response regulator [Anaerolineales bacterium]|nr:response regulator [Anaerolineales bacterium]
MNKSQWGLQVVSFVLDDSLSVVDITDNCDQVLGVSAEDVLAQNTLLHAQIPQLRTILEANRDRASFLSNPVKFLRDGQNYEAVLLTRALVINEVAVYTVGVLCPLEAHGMFQQRERELLETELLQRSVTTILLQIKDPDAAIERALAVAGEGLDVSRAYVFHFQTNERFLDNTHEWCAPDIKPEIDNLQGLPFDEMLPSFFPMLLQQGMIAPTHIQELPDDIQAILAPQNVQTILHMPFYVNGRLQGFIGFDENRRPRTWLPEEVSTLRMLTEGYARALERADFEKRLIEARQAALHSVQTQNEFISMISHELRTPLTGIVGMLELLQETDLAPEQGEFVEIAQESAHLLASIIDTMLDFSRLESGRMVLDSKPVDLRGILVEIAAMAALRLESGRIQFQSTIAEDVPQRVFGDANRIRQVLMNLVDNAIKFTEAGEISVHIQHLSTLNDRVRLRFEVRDTGIGIPADQLGRIFESFVQVDQSMTRKYGGMGLGLTIAKQLVTLMGGEIKVRSEVGGGSVFQTTLTFALAPSAMVADTPHRSVWVIDADDTSRYVVSQQLRYWGFAVIELERIQGLEPLGMMPDVVIYHITALDGITVTATLRRYFPESILLYLDDREGTQLALQEGFDGRLVRPLSETQFRALLDRPIVETAPAPSKPRCMVVDDNPEICMLVKHILEREGIEVTVLHDGKEALTAFEGGAYQLVLMDMKMPNMGGLEVTEHIRSRSDEKRHIPIVVLTGSAQEDEQWYTHHGINAVLGKPFTPQQVRAVVRQWLPST